MKVISLLVLVVCCGLSHGACPAPTSAPDPGKLDMFGLINILYYKADANRDQTITKPELQAIWDAFDVNADKIITPAEFIPSWGAVTTMSHELSKAYFFLADIDDSGLITTSDLDLIYQRFDMDGDGTVTAHEFNMKWQQLYREAPFAVLYLRADEDGNDDLTEQEFTHLFSSFANDGEQSVSRVQFTQCWANSGFGTSADGETIFSNLDTNHDGAITAHDMTSVFPHYDTNHNHDIELLELVEMAKIVLMPTSDPVG